MVWENKSSDKEIRFRMRLQINATELENLIQQKEDVTSPEFLEHKLNGDYQEVMTKKSNMLQKNLEDLIPTASTDNNDI